MKIAIVFFIIFVLTATKIFAGESVSSGCKLARIKNVQENCSLKEPEEKQRNGEFSNKFRTYDRNAGFISRSKVKTKVSLKQLNSSLSRWEGKNE